MEEVIVAQTDAIKRLENIIENISTDSTTRKSVDFVLDYVQEQVEALDSQCIEIEGNHNILIEIEDRSHEYFKKNIYQMIREKYNTIRKQLLAIHNPTTPPTTSISQKPSPSKADELIRAQKTNFRALARLINSIDIDNITEKWKLEDKLDMLNARWKSIDKLHWEIDNLLGGSETAYETQFTEYEQTYENIKCKLNTKLNNASIQQTTTPRVELPTFSGNYTQWPTFMDLYIETIHKNPLLTDVQKMQQLKSKLRGEADRLVQHLNISAHNYSTCWNILLHRYNNKQLLFTTQIKLFMKQPNIQKQTSYELKRLHDVSMETIYAVKNLGVDTSTWDPLLVHVLAEKLDPDTYTSYMEARKHPRELPIFDEFMEFLETKFMALEPLNSKAKTPSTNANSAKDATIDSTLRKYPNKSLHSNYERTCPICKTGHILYYCKTFQTMTTDNKLKTLDNLKVCRNCLYCHNGTPCTSEKRCKQCNAQHHTMLHETLANLLDCPSKQSKSNQWITKSAPHNMTNNAISQYNEVLLPTLLLQVRKADGTFTQLRALLDQGSQVTLITERAVQRLGINRQHHSGTVSGVGNTANQSRGIVELYCRSIFDDGKAMSVQAVVMLNVIGNLPNSTFIKETWPHLQTIKLADPDYNVSRDIDILLDASVYSTIILDGIIRGPGGAPIAQLTTMGWVVSGKVMKTFNCCVTLNNLEEISKFWEMEDISTKNDDSTLDNDYCEQLYEETTERSNDGRYHVRIPMKQNFEHNLGTSKPQAVAQFKQLERRMARDNLTTPRRHTKGIHYY